MSSYYAIALWNVIGNYKPVIGNYKSVIGNYKPVTGNYKSVIGNYKPVIGNFRTVIGNYKPVIGKIQTRKPEIEYYSWLYKWFSSLNIFDLDTAVLYTVQYCTLCSTVHCALHCTICSTLYTAAFGPFTTFQIPKQTNIINQKTNRDKTVRKNVTTYIIIDFAWTKINPFYNSLFDFK